MNLHKICNKIIEYSFYTLFLLVPLVFSQYTSELFELNKMWVTFGFTVIILSAWAIKMIAEKKFLFRRTFFDLPLLLFFLSQLISTFATLDPHISWWGYYSRFNGGFLSTLCYLILFYAFITNLTFRELRRSIYVTVITGIGVALWGLPAHFGKDPTCLLFRGSFDTTCWTEAFQPTVRIFSTLGQPAWMAAYLAFLIPLTIAFSLKYFISGQNIAKNKNYKLFALCSLLFALLFYLDLIFANTRAGFIGFWLGNIVFWTVLLIKNIFPLKEWLKYAAILNTSFLLLNFIFGFPLPGAEKFTLQGLTSYTKEQFVVHAQAGTTPTTTPTNGINITDSGNIRQIVWKGSIEAWKKSPLFGTGVETFAFAYYASRPAEHNLTSEWDYLYNKAHNEYLNYLTTTGLFGLGSYLFMIASTIYFAFLFLKEKYTTDEEKKIFLLAFGLFSGWTTILVTNFFGFSVVIMNIFFFLTPAFLLFLYTHLHPENKYLKSQPEGVVQKGYDAFQWTGIITVTILGFYLLLGLLNYWYADKAYALGYNLNRVGQYQEAYVKLDEAVKKIPNEPIYKDELALNLATIATAMSLDQAASTPESNAQATQAAQMAISLSNETTQKYSNNIVFWKNRVKIFFLLNQSNLEGKELFPDLALKSLEKVNSLAPTDAKVLFNLGSLLKTKDLTKAATVLERTVELKPDYTDAFRELGLIYKEISDVATDPTQKNAQREKAIATFEKVLQLNPNDQKTKDLLQQLK